MLQRKHNEHVFRRVNEISTTLSTAFASGEPQTLDDLLSKAERDWSLKSYGPPPEVDPQTVALPPREVQPRISRPPPPPSSRREKSGLTFNPRPKPRLPNK
jgi:hypothetical protein